MSKVNSIIECIGKTPLIRIQKMNPYENEIYVKMESLNPLSSIKDRVALALIEQAEKDGLLKPNSVIIEPTSGNTGIGLAYVAAVKGYKLILTMPETMSMERRKLLKALGAELVLTEGSLGMRGAIEKADEIASQTKDSFIPRQFDNPANPQIHFETTGPEIWNDSEGNVNIIIATVGTGGTLTGIGSYLKSKKPSVQVVAIEPDTSAVLSGKASGAHPIQGIGAGFIPSVLDTKIIDEIYLTNEEKAFSTARMAVKKEGLLIGISSGAALEAALTIASRPENKGKTIVAILPDSGERYLSTTLFES
ncbi:MAG TPA: cysteine synthase A [Fibrobacteraceae bacterium]|jgi:cysteine synthase|nr:cysteine synthase A [Fibrobacteraceae bacterium]HPW94047.1 cysteine synthase A [Fibrobacteraceae bacterium]